ncbi:MAG: Lrp/AsnC family transcriptional regulator [archaeon]
MSVDEKDIIILQKLQEDMTKSYKAIADELDMPATTVYNRVKKMEESRVIKGYKPILDATKLGFPTTCFLLITVTFKDSKGNVLDLGHIAEEIAEDPRVQEVHIVAGDWDILVKMKTKDVQQIGDFINNRLRYIEGVEKSLSCISFGMRKETLDLPLGSIDAPALG